MKNSPRVGGGASGLSCWCESSRRTDCLHCHSPLSPVRVLRTEWWMPRTYLLAAGVDHEAATLCLALQDGLIQNREGAFLSLSWKWLNPRDSQGHTLPVTSE